MKLYKGSDKRVVFSGVLIALSAAIFFCLLNNLDNVQQWFSTLGYYISPVTSGLMLAYILRPFARFMEKRLLKGLKSEKLRVHISGITTVVLLILVIYFLIRTLIPQMIYSGTEFANNIDIYITSIKELITKYASKIDFIEINVDELIGSSDEILTAAADWVKNNISLFVDLLYQLGSQLFNFVIVLAMSIYALLDRKNLQRGLVRLELVTLGEARTTHLNRIISRGDAITTKFLGSNLLDALIVGVVNFIFLSIFEVDYSLILSVFLGATNFVPTFGPIVGGVIAAFVILLTKPTLFFGFIIFTLILQQIDGNVIKPVLFGDTTGMSPFWVLVAIVVGGRIFGVLGMILGVPLFAILSSVYTEVIDKQLAKRESASASEAADAPPEPPREAPPAPQPPKQPKTKVRKSGRRA